MYTHTTRYLGDITRIRGAHILIEGQHIFYAGAEKAMEVAFNLDEEGTEYELNNCGPECPHRPK